MSDMTVISSITELYEFNDPKKYPRGFDLVEVYRNGAGSLVGCITRLDLRRRNEFLFQSGIPVKIHVWNSLFPKGPLMKPDRTPPQWLRFGKGPEEVSCVICNWHNPVRASRMKHT